MNRIGLIDVDGHNFPNIALMKISSFYKDKGDVVDWVNHFESYDKVYMSKIFTFSPDEYHHIQCNDISKGGTGYDIKSKLSCEIENVTNLDYSLYPQYNFSVQFFSRGCIRACPFCLVNKKEGKIHSVEPMNLNPNGKHIEVLDNNFFANPNWKEAVKWLQDAKQPINLHGVDVRIMNEEQAYHLNTLKIKGNIHIAWDNPKDDIIPKIKDMLKWINKNKIICYVLIGYWSTIEQDIERVEKLREIGIKPFVQAYRDFDNERTPTQYEKDFMYYVNKRQVFNTCKFEDFMPRKGFRCNYYIKNKH